MITIYEWCKNNKKIKYLTSMLSTKNVENPKDIPFYTKKHYYFIYKKNHIWKSMASRR